MKCLFLEVGDCSISYSSNGKSRVMKKKSDACTHENCRSNTLKVAGGLFLCGRTAAEAPNDEIHHDGKADE